MNQLESAAVQDDKRDILEYMKKFRLEEVLNDVSNKFFGIGYKQAVLIKTGRRTRVGRERESWGRWGRGRWILLEGIVYLRWRIL